jgi:hypothetical protein
MMVVNKCLVAVELIELLVAHNRSLKMKLFLTRMVQKLAVLAHNLVVRKFVVELQAQEHKVQMERAGVVGVQIEQVGVVGVQIERAGVVGVQIEVLDDYNQAEERVGN